MENSGKLGTIKIYGKVIDLDNISNEELEKIQKILKQRESKLDEEYLKLYSEIYG